MYNPNLNHWCVVRQTFELPASGGVVPNNFYTITKLIRSQLTLNDELFKIKTLLRYTTTEDYVVMGAELVLLFFCVFYTIEEIIEITTLKKQYFKGFFNNADWIVILMCFLILGHRLVFNRQFTPHPYLSSGPSSTSTLSRQ